MIQGGCYCGAVRYAAEGTPRHLTACHCRACRGTTGAPHVGWITLPRTGFRFTAGTPTRFRSSAVGTRSFCPTCGTQLAFVSDAQPDAIDVTTASLDAPDSLPPRDHTWVSRKLAWVTIPDGLPAYREGRPPDASGTPPGL
ncbi:hypothetical protein OPKNFCMD_3404 [Methylobacterium crusticola]|uniref:CENP-V/GFA domain-containing protein n=1 Tax=Methylobacterium crusticola TaxID=1697972 RepID=A0ABQ4R1E0_9HYPH|nr:GFA family protein [Methylobacterium crusticola]GJD50661.1 hypothetical protein OPKNFCMD_3404 [Methylobacterium crusticola]